MRYLSTFLQLSFQLTPSRRATSRVLVLSLTLLYFNSRPHGGRHRLHSARFRLDISTHALTEGDRKRHGDVETLYAFQLTPSRRATASASTPRIFPCHFNSRPHGGRLRLLSCIQPIFISTHALTEGDCECRSCPVKNLISTHALTEGDLKFIL